MHLRTSALSTSAFFSCILFKFLFRYSKSLLTEYPFFCTSQKDVDVILSNHDDFPKRQMFQVGVSIQYHLSIM